VETRVPSSGGSLRARSGFNGVSALGDKKESELLTSFFDGLRYSLFRRANVRGAGFRPRLVQVCMQIRWKVRWGRIAGPCGDSGYSVVADPQRWLSDVLIGAYRREDASGAGTDETTLDKITCGAKPSGHVPGHDCRTPLPIILVNFLRLLNLEPDIPFAGPQRLGHWSRSPRRGAG
jgi:hypothetical protein